MDGTQTRPAATNITSPIQVKRLFRQHDTLLARAQLYLSVLATTILLLGLAYWYLGDAPTQYRQLAMIAGLLTLIVYQVMGVYRQARGRIGGAIQITKAWAIVVCAVLLLVFMSKTSASFSRVVIGSWIVLGYVAQITGNLLLYGIAQKYNLHFGRPVRTLVVGSNWLAKHLVDSLNKNTWLPDTVVGVVDNNQEGKDEWDDSDAPWLGSISDIVAIVERQNIRRVYIALPLGCSDMIETIYHKLLAKNVDIVWAPDIFALKLLNHGVREMAGVPLLTLSESPWPTRARPWPKP